MTAHVVHNQTHVALQGGEHAPFSASSLPPRAPLAELRSRRCSRRARGIPCVGGPPVKAVVAAALAPAPAPAPGLREGQGQGAPRRQHPPLPPASPLFSAPVPQTAPMVREPTHSAKVCVPHFCLDPALFRARPAHRNAISATVRRVFSFKGFFGFTSSRHPNLELRPSLPDRWLAAAAKRAPLGHHPPSP